MKKTNNSRPESEILTDQKGKHIIPIERIEHTILLIRGEKVILDSDLAELYGVTTKRLNEQVRRNLKRFPPDFMFQLSNQENGFLRSHFATLKRGRGQYRKYLPYAFTEHGAIMAASVLNTPRAVETIKQLMAPPEPPKKKPIGFLRDK